MTAHPEQARGLRVIGRSDLGGHGDGMQVLRHEDALYVAHFGPSGMGTTVLDVSDPSTPRPVRQWRAPEGSHTHKVQVADGLLLVNEERFRGAERWSAGMAVYDVAADPFAPRLLGRYAHASATPEGRPDRVWMVIDLADPSRPVEAARWELDEPQPAGKRYAAHHALFDGRGRGYLGYGDAGLVVLDVAEVTRPRKLARLDWEPGGGTHTCLHLPGRKLVVVTDEQTRDGPGAEPRLVRVVDVSDPAEPRVLSVCPQPGPEFDALPLRYGPHNLHENRVGSYRSERVVFVTYFNAGLRVYDLGEPEHPVELAWWLPDAPAGQQAPQTNDVWVEAGGRVWLTDRFAGGLHCLEPERALAELLQAASH